MPCDAVAISAFIWLASAPLALTAGAAPASVETPHSVATEPLFVDIVRRAGGLRAQTEALGRGDLDRDFGGLAAFAAFKADIGELAALDMKGHVVLAARGTDGDLKCILKGISQDLPVKLAALEAAATAKARRTAINELDYLLRDNVEVITSPPPPPA